MISIKYGKTISVDLIKKVIDKYPNEDMMIVIENTKNQSSEKLEEIATTFPNKKIIISVLGGLNPTKQKYNDHYYQSRTYHTPLELGKIISVFEKIERKINIDWSELEKAIFIYASLCQMMTYDEIKVDGKDVSRNLSGLIYGKAVCSGFALILKEAYDRVGIECIYQNVSSYHSWNIVKINGQYYGVDLTWDCCKKDKRGCRFYHFGLEPNFYNVQSGARNLEHENEEKKYPISTFKIDELNNAIVHINSSGYKIYPLNIDREIYIEGIGLLGRINNGQLNILNWNVRKFVRKDKSIFYLIYAGSYKNLHKLFYFDESNNKFRGAYIYSETPLHQLPSEYEDDVANNLLSRERLARKINQFNGYVGYIGKKHNMNYNPEFEQEELNIIR